MRRLVRPVNAVRTEASTFLIEGLAVEWNPTDLPLHF